MHRSTITLECPVPYYHHGISKTHVFLQNQRLTLSTILLPIPRGVHSVFHCSKGLEISAPRHALSPTSYSSSSSSSSPSSGNGSVSDLSFNLRSVSFKNVDVATLGNLCVDIVLNVPTLPPSKAEDRKAYMEQLSASSPDKKYWEAGGNCNMAIAAARLGLNCTAIGHVGSEIYGNFLVDVLYKEGIDMVGMSEHGDVIDPSSSLYETLLCWVLVDPSHRHGFCSVADFSEEPAFNWISKLSGEVKKAIKRSKVLFCNGYGFDELSPRMITSTIEYAVEVGTSVFFDPGPRGKSLSIGTPEERRALSQLLRLSDVILLTSDEAESLTGIKNPILAGKELLNKSLRTKWVIVKMGARGSILITSSSISCAPTFHVKVLDTVGCGDSFVAAVAFGFINKLPPVNTLAVANAVGAATAMGCGAGRNVATLEKVLELIRESNLNEDVDFWNELLSGNLDAEEITVLSKGVVKGSNNSRVNRVPLQKVVSELLPRLEPAQFEGKVTS